MVSTLPKLENAHTITVKGMTLYFGQNLNDSQILSYGLPPKPPAPSTDIRFSGDTRFCTLDECMIEVMNADQTLAIECDIKGNEDWEMVDERGEVYECSSDEVFMLNGNYDTLILRKSTTSISPFTYSISPAYPNPFNPVTTIQYTLPKLTFTTIKVYDVLGHEISILVNTNQEAGSKTVQWDGKDKYGKPVTGGVYLYQIKAGEYIQTCKLVLLK
jgi:hypothetical protein